jgi:hypothetical protein
MRVHRWVQLFSQASHGRIVRQQAEGVLEIGKIGLRLLKAEPLA